MQNDRSTVIARIQSQRAPKETVDWSNKIEFKETQPKQIPAMWVACRINRKMVRKSCL